MLKVDNIIITDKKVKRNKDNKILTIVIIDKAIGMYNSYVLLKERGYSLENFVERDTVKLNPRLFTQL